MKQQDFSFIAGVGMQNGTATSEGTLAVSHKAKRRLNIDPSIVLLSIYLNGLKTYVHAKNIHTNVQKPFIHGHQKQSTIQDFFR